MTQETLGCTHVDIAMSVSADGGAVYSPPVLGHRGQAGADQEVWQPRGPNDQSGTG